MASGAMPEPVRPAATPVLAPSRERAFGLVRTAVETAETSGLAERTVREYTADWVLDPAGHWHRAAPPGRPPGEPPDPER
jgi:hypothetical protein